MFKFIYDINFHRRLNIPAPPVRMSLQSSLFTFSFTTPCSSSSHETSTPTITPFLNPVTRQSNQPDSSGRSEENNGELLRASSRSCMCGRRHFLEAASTALFPICPSIASDNLQPRYKESAVAAGLPLSNFEFIQAVGEAIPLNDASVDAVVGTLVLCSVEEVGQTLQEVKRVLKPGGLYLFVEHVAAKDGTILRLLQSALDPLQQTVADGCHLSRDTGKEILKAGFSSVDLSMAFLSNALIINPHVYGIASK
uniref:Methyltransferase type 11 domain-containing protein n=1 Tax=Populus trichocarpa TaxID=3694 RepID=A0A3N7G6M3_POPTR